MQVYQAFATINHESCYDMDATVPFAAVGSYDPEKLTHEVLISIRLPLNWLLLL